MLISKFDLYKPEWLELVFANRNQQYGAYEMRASYASTLTRAMAITFFAVGVVATAVTIISNSKHLPEEGIVVNIPETPTVHLPKDRVITPKQPQKSAASQPKTNTSVTTQQFIPMKVTVDHLATEDIKPIVEGVAVGQEDVKGTGTSDNVLPTQTTGSGGAGTVPSEDVGIHTIGETLDVMPEPVGGDGAWAKFLQKNLRFPPVAQEQGVSGKVFISFIIEKDGHLSDITVIRKAGFGFDEEALRVLKLAPAWKPGAQNGQKVRVKYTIPINFQINE